MVYKLKRKTFRHLQKTVKMLRAKLVTEELLQLLWIVLFIIVVMFVFLN